MKFFVDDFFRNFVEIIIIILDGKGSLVFGF